MANVQVKNIPLSSSSPSRDILPLSPKPCRFWRKFSYFFVRQEGGEMRLVARELEEEEEEKVVGGPPFILGRVLVGHDSPNNCKNIF